MVASLITRVEANHFDGRTGHVATVSLAHEVMLLVVECVVLVFALVVLAAAGAYCYRRRCCRDTATRECRGSLPKHDGASENAIVTESECSGRRRLMEATLRGGDEACRQGVEGRPNQETDAWAWRATTDGRTSSGAVVRPLTLGLEAGRLCLDRRCWGNRADR